MSWHCGFCGKVEGCNTLIYVVDIRGGIPKKLCCHTSCLANSLGEGTEDIKEELVEWEKEMISETKEKEN